MDDSIATPVKQSPHPHIQLFLQLFQSEGRDSFLYLKFGIRLESGRQGLVGTER